MDPLIAVGMMPGAYVLAVIPKLLSSIARSTEDYVGSNRYTNGFPYLQSGSLRAQRTSKQSILLSPGCL